MNYYELGSDQEASPFWYLEEPRDRKGKEFEARSFLTGRKWLEGEGTYHKAGTVIGPYSIPLGSNGVHVDFNLASFDMIVMPARINQKLEKLLSGDVIQRISVNVEDENEVMEILNLLDVVHCIDMRRSDYDVKDESSRPTLNPEEIRGFGLTSLYDNPETVNGIVIDPEKTKGHKLFRPKGWNVCPICDEDVKSFLETENVTGIAFNKIRCSHEVTLNKDFASLSKNT